MTSLFGGSQTVVQAPTPLPPPTMPDPNSPANIAAGQQQAQKDAQRAGRQSTILTTPGSRAPSTIAGGALGGARPAVPATGSAPSYTNASL